MTRKSADNLIDAILNETLTVGQVSGHDVYEVIEASALARDIEKTLLVRRGEVVDEKLARDRANNIAAGLMGVLVI